MSFLPSLLLYNPLEAFIILLFCNVCSGTKTKTRIILDSYILGTLNFVVQYPNMLLENPMWQLVYNIFVVLIVMPIIVYLYCHNKFKFSYRICTAANLFILSTGMIVAWFSNTFITTVITNEFENGCYEMIFNLVLRAFELLLILILYKGKCLYEKVSQKDG
jgi:hypothetical protein